MRSWFHSPGRAWENEEVLARPTGVDTECNDVLANSQGCGSARAASQNESLELIDIYTVFPEEEQEREQCYTTLSARYTEESEKEPRTSKARCR